MTFGTVATLMARDAVPDPQINIRNCFCKFSRKNSVTPGYRMNPLRAACLFAAHSLSAFVAAADAEPLRLIDLGGPAHQIGGRSWEAGPTSLGKELSQFENQAVPLTPPVSGGIARMIRSSLWNGGGRNHLRIDGLPEGDLTVFLYVWEDNNRTTWSGFLNGRETIANHDSGPGGTWHRLGPWHTLPREGAIELTSTGGAANWSGLEIWPGRIEMHPSDLPVEPPKEATAGQIHFKEVIAPILSRHCVECHNPSDAKGELDLTTARGAAEAIVAGIAARSELWVQVDDGEMPKKRPPLTDAEQRLLEEWIDGGAEWSDEPVDPYLATSSHRAGYDWWSLQPVKPQPLPETGNTEWPRNEVDRFILQKLENASLQPGAEADLRTLARRVSFDLTGLPPEPQSLEDLIRDERPDGYERYVDGLLASPAFGEHWARHWLDVIRFGETQGFERNRIRENAWRFRDWVVRAFNSDMPYDEFVRLQLAGDVLRPDDLDTLVATGYHVAGTWDQVGHNEGSQAMRQVVREEHLEDLVGTLSQTFLGLTVQCARCHDHKFDPIPQKDYFRMAALIGGVHQQEKERGGIGLKASEQQPGFSGAAHVPHFRQPDVFHVLNRGNFTEPGEVVTPGGLTGLRVPEPDFELQEDAPEAERRRRLADWITRADHPLTSRVIANRLWHYLFGAGLVDTPSDFGFNGGQPSHPELLDWLAGTLVDDEWRMKPMIRRLVTSTTYRQRSGAENEAAMAVDSGNRLVWRAPLKRLSAEQARDSMLAVSGTLDRRPGGPSFRDVKVKLENNHEFTDAIAGVPPENRRRTLYRLWASSGGHPLLECLDAAAPGVTLPRRASTITPLQALSLMNDPLCIFAAENFAKRLRAEAGDDPRAQIRRGWALAFGRSPIEIELNESAAFLEAHGLEQTCLVLFNANEFLFLR